MDGVESFILGKNELKSCVEGRKPEGYNFNDSFPIKVTAGV